MAGGNREVVVVEQARVGAWVVERRRGPAAALHALTWPAPLVPTVWLLEVDRPALVLGSTQQESSVDPSVLADLGVELARRRSGGGAVLLEPGASVWIDVLLPRGHERWDDDVSRSFHWLGEAWAAALGELGLSAEVHRGPLVRGGFGRQVCFAGIGPGEVTIEGAGAHPDPARWKVIGLSQRRARTGARFQCVVHRSWNPAPLAALADVAPDELPPVAVVAHPTSAIEAALLARLA
jgi:lipoate-protein ligase A